jgi:DNA-binding MarR family transcriptional regulator
VLSLLILIQGILSPTVSPADFNSSNEGILWNEVDLYIYGQDEHEEYPGVPPYGPNMLTGGELCTMVPISDETIRAQAPLYYNPISISPNPKEYALFASYIMYAKEDMNIDGEALLSVWVEVDATDINPWNMAMSRFRFDILDNNDVVRGRAEIEVENYIDVIKEVEAIIPISDYEMNVDDYYTLQFWYSGVGEFYILYGSQQCPSRLSIPTDSVKSESSIDHDKGEGIVTVSSIISDSLTMADIKEIELRIYAPWETNPVFTEIINVSIIENASLEGNSSISKDWTQWIYREDLDTGAIPEGNYTIEISAKDNSSNIWKEIHEVNLFVFVKVTTVILIVIGGTSVLGFFGWVYRDIIKFGTFSLMLGLPLLSKTVDTDRTKRGKLLQVIQDNPGIWYEELKRKSEVTNGTAAYHLKQLVKEGEVISIMDKNKRRFFDSKESARTEGGYITDVHQSILSAIGSSKSVGITAKQIKNSVGLSRRRVNDYLNTMLAKGLIDVKPDSRDRRIIRYYAKGEMPSELTPSIREYIHEILNLSPHMDSKTISERIKQFKNVTISEQQIDEFLRSNYPSRWLSIKERPEIGSHG